MIREILFRGRRVDNGEWVEGDLFNNYDGRKFIGELIVNDYVGNAHDDYELGIGFYEVDPETVGQWTGLVDKNGVKIFEGDVVRYKECHKFSYNSTLDEHVAEGGDYIEVEEIVAYRNCEFTPRPMRDDCEDYWYSYANFDFEVVCNMYDNPELVN